MAGSERSSSSRIHPHPRRPCLRQSRITPFLRLISPRCTLHRYGRGRGLLQKPRHSRRPLLPLLLLLQPRNASGTRPRRSVDPFQRGPPSVASNLLSSRKRSPGTVGVLLPPMMYVSDLFHAFDGIFIRLFSQTSKGPVSCDDKEGHYIIVPDDLIYRRCMSSILIRAQCTHMRLV
jgi:hypothetical protein